MRTLKEWKAYQKDDFKGTNLKTLAPVSDDLYNWIAIIQGEPGTPYSGGTFKLRISIPESYPTIPPNIKFETKICHPNIHFNVSL